MKSIIALLVTAVTILMFLAACSPAGTPIAEKVPEIVAEPTIDTSDLTLIGNTGRPQLLNAFASW
ncbi:MAG: hypothetical protein DWQ04_04290 [Chloroflexi bacterium]|nr:MAG: hypothetical protein DWQ04_04290 [Chloroflexota bacterium]